MELVKKQIVELNRLLIYDIFVTIADITPWIKQIDTVSAEWPAATNYLYLTYCSASSHDVVPTPGAIMVLGK